MPKTSVRAQRITPSATLAITAKAKAMKGVISFGAGEPDFPTPANIAEAGKRAIDEGFTKYTPAAGTVELRKAICSAFEAQTGLSYDPKRCIVSCGAKASVFIACQAILDAGDEAILIAPYWTSYPEMVKMAGGTPIYVTAEGTDGFVPSAQAIRGAVSRNTHAIIVNSPCNPTGAVLPRELLGQIAELALKMDFWIITDEIYNKLTYVGPVPSLAEFGPEVAAKTIFINGASKTYAMTGWRVGWALGPGEIIEAMEAIQSHSTSGPASMCDRAALESLTGPQETVEDMRAVFMGRRDLILERLRAIEGISVVEPAGAFYVFPDVSSFYGRQLRGRTIFNSETFADYLLEEAKIAVVPGSAFAADDHVRLSFACSEEDIEEGLGRMAKALVRL